MTKRVESRRSTKMTKDIDITWDEATSSSGFVKFEAEETKILKITNWKLEKIEKFNKEQIELVADVLEEDGETVEKKFTTTSNRLKKKLRPLLETKKPEETITISVLKVGDKYDTQLKYVREDCFWEIVSNYSLNKSLLTS